jgi:probable rRNA maturation factor
LILKIDVPEDHTADAGIDLPALASEVGLYLESTGLRERDVVRVVLSFVSSDEIRGLNAMYREVQEPTDVLSFPLWEEDGAFSPPSWGDELPLGDVVISPECVMNNALSEGAGYEGEIALVAIHGILHLIGFDHDTDERRVAMWGVQERLRDGYLNRRADCARAR